MGPIYDIKEQKETFFPYSSLYSRGGKGQIWFECVSYSSQRIHSASLSSVSKGAKCVLRENISRRLKKQRMCFPLTQSSTSTYCLIWNFEIQKVPLSFFFFFSSLEQSHLAAKPQLSSCYAVYSLFLLGANTRYFCYRHSNLLLSYCLLLQYSLSYLALQSWGWDTPNTFSFVNWFLILFYQ